MRLILIGINIILVLSLLPWIALSIWFANFLNDAIQAEPRGDFVILEVLGHSLVLLYPVFVVYGIIASRALLKRKSSKSVVLLNALSPILALLLAAASLFLPVVL